ncbi:MAG: hypothetical protein IKP28_00760 [Clostridia bacterium]|nr:hypothetical protein [Clostridia bacterium]
MLLHHKSGTPSLSYKSPLDFGKVSNLEAEQPEEIVFNVLNSETKNFTNPVVYNNLNSPITLTYVNKNIKSNYQISKDGAVLVYDGSLLKSANIDPTKLNCGISFRVKIITTDNEKFQSTLFIDIPYKSDTSSILDGYLLTTIPMDNKCIFYQL